MLCKKNAHKHAVQPRDRNVNIEVVTVAWQFAVEKFRLKNDIIMIK